MRGRTHTPVTDMHTSELGSESWSGHVCCRKILENEGDKRKVITGARLICTLKGREQESREKETAGTLYWRRLRVWLYIIYL